MFRNKLRELLRKGEPTLGTHVHTTWPGVIEVIGHTGVFDYVEFTSTYAPYDLYVLDDMARAAELVDLSLMIKVDLEPRAYLAQKAISSGFNAILFADLFDAEDARECVRAVKTEPKGVNGFGLWRMAGYVFLDKGKPLSVKDYVDYLNDIVIAVMIERKSAVENLEEILSVGGIDMVQFGPGDYSISIGHPGDLAHPDVKEAEMKVIKTALDMGVRPRVELNDAKDMKKYMDLGVKDFCIGTDVKILSDWCREVGGEARRLLSKR
ncbi:MAG: 2,4-dihydroxyhept-2-ene-1,7-dioic acid aldolase [Thaumarchaeota archaeon]|nr:2,4-dihydroxyhept-2-ene-1,7-dioic acid aldolase [Nitrososphaerota archaeon]